jgi:signal transduction histidine kinase
VVRGFFWVMSGLLQFVEGPALLAALRYRLVLRLRVIDDGRGFEALEPPRALRERAQAIGARLTVQSRPEYTVVQLEFD